MDTSKHTPAERLEIFLNLKKISFDDFARLINEDKLVSNANKYVGNGKKNVFKKQLDKLHLAGLNKNWYLTGVGDMEIQEFENNNIVNISDKDTISDIANIKLYNFPVNANLGTAVHFDDLPYTYMPLSVGLKLDMNKCIALRVIGDSMRDAHIFDGDTIVIEKDRKPISGNYIFALHNGVPIVKMYEKNENSYSLYSMNGGKLQYPVSENDVISIFGVVRIVLRIT
ncbi:MAG: S24 family peptidase [Ignavibacteria bacterium]|jgi:DNA polymerase V|nr:S24 family peptidase [Ignavibacteria bacterium]